MDELIIGIQINIDLENTLNKLKVTVLPYRKRIAKRAKRSLFQRQLNV